MADHDIRHARILEALEEEKKKIAEELERMQKKTALKVPAHRNGTSLCLKSSFFT